jgi:hypothetical protein
MLQRYIMKGIRRIAPGLCCILLMLFIPAASFSQIKSLSKNDQTLFRHAKNKIEKDINLAFADFNTLKNKYPSNIDVCYYLAECYYRLKMFEQALSEYMMVTLLIRNNLNNPEFQKNKEKYTEWQAQCKGKITSCKSFLALKTEVPEKENVAPSQNENGEGEESEKSYDSGCDQDFRGYEDETFIEFSSDNQAAQQKQLKDHVIKIYNDLFQNKSTPHNKDGKVINCINQQWLKENATKNYEWFENFKKKEDDLFLAIQQYNNEIYNRSGADNEKRRLENELKFLNSQLQMDENNRQLLERSIDKEIKEGLLKKLATIPTNVVMIGRMSIESGEQDEAKATRLLTDKIDSLLKIRAIEKVNGFTVQMTTLTYQDQLNSILKKTVKGNARTVDTYYKKIVKDGPLGTKFLYKIIKIEVYPYDTINSAKRAKIQSSVPGQDNSKDSQEFNAFILDDNCSVNKIDEGGVETKINITELELKQEQTSYVRNLCSTSNAINRKYQGKIEEAAKQYDVELIIARSKLDSITKKIENTKADIKGKQILINQKTSFLDNSTILNNLQIKLFKAKKEYDAALQSKTTVTNQLGIESTAQALSNNILFGNLSTRCYNVINDIKRNEIEMSITVINYDRNKNIFNERYNMRFDAIPKAFQVLSINVVDGEEDEHSLFLNIAFKIGYNKKDSSLITSATHTEDVDLAKSSSGNYDFSDLPVVSSPDQMAGKNEVTTANMSENVLLLDPVTKIISESSTSKKWKLYEEIPTSYRAFSSSEPGEGYTVPDFQELCNFFATLSKQQKKGKDFFKNIFPFEGEPAVFLSSDTVNPDGTEQLKCLQVFLPDYKTATVYKEDGEVVNVLMIRRK